MRDEKRIVLLPALSLMTDVMSVMAEGTIEKKIAEELLVQARAKQKAENSIGAVSLLQRAADMGNAEAQDALGVCYFRQLGVERDYEKAFNCFMLAAEQGNAETQHHVGLFCRNGFGVKQDFEKAAEYDLPAVDQGNAGALNNLAFLYDLGVQGSPDHEQAAKYNIMTADLENAAGRYNLGICSQEGKGVKQSFEEALRDYTPAAEQGDADNQYILAAYTMKEMEENRITGKPWNTSVRLRKGKLIFCLPAR